MWAYRARITQLSLVSLVGALLEAVFLVLITGIAMALFNDKPQVGPFHGLSLSIASALWVATGLLVVRLIFSLLNIAVSARMTADVTQEQRQRLSHTYLRAQWSIQQAEAAGRLQDLLTSFVSRVTQSVQTLTTAITAVLSLAAFLLTGLAVDAASTGAVLVALAVVGAVLQPLRRRIRKRSLEGAGINLDFARGVAEFGNLGLEMQTFGVRDRFLSAIDDMIVDYAANQQRVQRLVTAMAPIYTTLAYGAVLAGVALLAWTGFEDLTVIGAVMLLMLRSLSYGQQLASASASLTSHGPFLERVNETIERYAANPATNGSTRPGRVTPMQLRDIAYSYDTGRTALAETSFVLAPGEVLGVIGPSGAGKSTLAQLVLGLREPTEGTIQVDGVDLRGVDREWFHRRVAFVAQDARLFTGTVAENIAFFRDGITREDLRRAATQANILREIEALPEGFDTHLGERATALSGGQRQRLSIARALAGSPELLVLDEPTSALDGHSEGLIRDTLRDLRGGVSIIIIAHRMSTLDICDRILVIEEGRMTAIDTPAGLRSHSEFYRRAMAVAGIAEDA